MAFLHSSLEEEPACINLPLPDLKKENIILEWICSGERQGNLALIFDKRIRLGSLEVAESKKSYPWQRVSHDHIPGVQHERDAKVRINIAEGDRQ